VLIANWVLDLQWTYRDGRLISLPWILLVEGDMILLRPGREAPCRCRAVNESTEFVAGQKYLLKEVREDENEPEIVEAFQPLLCQVTETPLRASLRIGLRAKERPVGTFDNELFRVVHSCIECYLLPAVTGLSILVALLRLLLFSELGGTYVDLIVIFPCSVLLPILGFIIPIFYYLINVWSQVEVFGSVLHLSEARKENRSLESLQIFTTTSDESEEKTSQAGSGKPIDSFLVKASLFKRLACGTSEYLSVSFLPVSKSK